MSFISKLFGGDKPAATQNKAISAFNNIGIPTAEAQKIILETPELVGQLFPDLEFAEQLEDTAYSDIEVPGDLKDKQLDALNTLNQIAQEGGLTPEDEAELRAIQRQVMGGAEARDASILQNMSERGMGGSGVELASRLAGNQAAQQTQAEMADRQASMAFQRKMEALNRVGDMSGKMRDQEFSEQSDVAKARDIMNQFNVGQRANVQQRNVATQNATQAANLGAKQATADRGVDLRNKQEEYNKGLAQKQFDNQMAQAKGTSTAYTSMAGTQQQQAANKQSGAGQILGGAVKLFSDPKVRAGVSSWFSDVNMKQDIEGGDESIENMMDNLDAYDFDYRPETGIEGRHNGVMAQDLERSELGGSFVEDTDEGKMVDYAEAAPTMMAGLANTNKRLRKLEKVAKMFLGEEE